MIDKTRKVDTMRQLTAVELEKVSGGTWGLEAIAYIMQVRLSGCTPGTSYASLCK